MTLRGTSGWSTGWTVLSSNSAQDQLRRAMLVRREKEENFKGYSTFYFLCLLSWSVNKYKSARKKNILFPLCLAETKREMNQWMPLFRHVNIRKESKALQEFYTSSQLFLILIKAKR